MKLFLLFLAALVVGEATQVDFDGAQLLQVVPRNEKQHQFFNNLIHQYDVWKFPKAEGDYGQVFAPIEELSTLKSLLRKAGLQFEVVNSNVGETIKKQREENDNIRRAGKTSMDWNAYHTYDEIMDWVDQLDDMYPDLVTVSDVGHSYEGRVMKLVKISRGTPAGAMFIDGGIHAREWISPATVTYMMNELLSNQDKYSDTLDKVDFYFMPVINPDGYAYSWEADRMWRKTRSPNAGSPCTGTDGNRNFEFHWAGAGSSGNPCSEAYYGSKPFSEIEMRVVADQMNSLNDAPRAFYLTYHSYSQFYLYPWGCDCSDLPAPANQTRMNVLGHKSARAIEEVYGTHYTVANSLNLYGPASGASDDYSVGVAGYQIAYTIELRDTGHYGFMLPPDQILPTGIETFEGFRVFFEYVRDNY